MDPRLRSAVDASLAWYDDVFAVHGIPTAVEQGVWHALEEPPRWHSAAKTTAPTEDPAPVVRAVERFGSCSVADSFGRLDLSGSGFDLLFEATWVHHSAADGTSALPDGWTVVRHAALIRSWNAAHDTAEVLLPAMLTHPRFTILARTEDDVLTGGAVLHDCPGEAVGLSNTWSASGTVLDPRAVLACAQALHPGRSVVDYAQGADLEAMVEAGFSRLGPQVVWVR